MIDKTVTRKDVLKALHLIDKYGVPLERISRKYFLRYNNQDYPPKYVLSIAAKFATGKELEPYQFNGGNETNKFLSSLGFTILKNNSEIQICSALIQIEENNQYWNNQSISKKYALLETIIKHLIPSTDLLILPAGFFNSKNIKTDLIFSEVEKTIIELIGENEFLTICFGIDGDLFKNQFKDQIVLAINKNGIVANGRKFYHVKDGINLADGPFELENNTKRILKIKGKTAYLAVCYDIFGISRNRLNNQENVNFIVGVIHNFGKGGGDSDFARKGLAGASKQWNKNIYASALFSENRNPANWPSGVKWEHGSTSVRDLNYEDIKIQSNQKIIEKEFGAIYLNYYYE